MRKIPEDLTRGGRCVLLRNAVLLCYCVTVLLCYCVTDKTLHLFMTLAGSISLLSMYVHHNFMFP